MRTTSLSLALALAAASIARADFNPIPLTPGSYNADVIVEKTAPPCIPAGYTASMDGGTNNNGNTWYERGYNIASPTTGLPLANSTFTHANDPNKQYTMPPSYTANNAVLIDSKIISGTLTLTTPAIFTSISILNSAGSGPLTVNYTVHHLSSPDETGSWSCLNWFNGTPAWSAGGRVQGDSGTTFNNVGTVNPQLFESDIAVSSASEVTSIDFAYAGAGAGHACIFALSGNNAGTTWTPITVTGFNRDMVVGATESSPTPLITATTASMDGGTVNNGNTWYERGYFPAWPNSGLPAPGTVINSVDKPDHHYLMPASYSAPNAIYVDAALPIANVTLASPQNYSALSFLNATANGTNVIQCTMQYEDGTSEVNTFVAKDWFNGFPFAYRSDGRVNLNNRSLNNFNAGVNPRLYEAEFVLGNNVSRITNVVMQWLAGAANARCVVLAVSATAGALKPIYGLQPLPVNTYENTTVTFNAALAGGTQPITFQWQKGTNGLFVNLADGGNISGSTTTNLFITTAAGSDVADYQMIAANSAGSVTSLVAHLTVLSTLMDVTSPSDPVTAFGGATPVGEEVIHTIDNVLQKYLNFGSGPNPNNPPFVGPVGLIVTPAVGLTRVTGLRLYTANDHPQRDPTDYILEGSLDAGATYTLISSGPLALPDGRNGTGGVAIDPLNQFLQQILFDNPNGYTTYKLTFTHIKDAAADNSMQIAEVELLGVTVQSPPVITQHPGSHIIYSGGSATFSVRATGSIPLSYQWRQDGSDIGGATSADFTTGNLFTSDGGVFTCVVTNANGSITSNPAMLTVIDQPTDPYPQAVMLDNPVAYWRLNETSGTVAHDYWSGHDGQYHNAGLGSFGYNAYDTDAAATFGSVVPDSYVGEAPGIDFAPDGAAATFSVEAWVKGGDQTNDAGIITKGNGGGGEQFNLDCGGTGHAFRFFVRDTAAAGHLCTSTNLPDGKWHHLVGVCDVPGGVVRLYVDGVEAASTTISGGVLASSHPVSLGGRQSAAGAYDMVFVGTVDEAIIYRHVLTPSQVQSHYNTGANTPTLTVTAQNASKACGSPNPSFSAIVTGFVNGDNSSILSGSPGLTTTADASSGPGTYPIVASQGTLTSSKNYRFAFVNATLTVFDPVAVSMSIAAQGANVDVTWPATCTSYRLQSTTNLGDEVTWTLLPNIPTLAGDHYVVSLSHALPQQFLRLVATTALAATGEKADQDCSTTAETVYSYDEGGAVPVISFTGHAKNSHGDSTCKVEFTFKRADGTQITDTAEPGGSTATHDGKWKSVTAECFGEGGTTCRKSWTKTP